MHTLERIARAAGPRFDDEALHAGLLLAYVQAAYGTVRTIAAPSPLYRLSYDETTHGIALDETDGSSRVPRADALDISDLDVILIGNLRDLPILFEGETGIGKTYISQAFLRAVFPADSFVSMRLSGSTFLNNVFQPFLEGRIEQGMPVTRVKAAAVDRIGALFVDEINRGDPQSILQLLDNELYHGGVYTRLGLPIPRLDAARALLPSLKRKKLLIISAQNPAVTTEAKFTGTVELDAAVDNRLLKIRCGNAARSVGSTLWLNEEVHQPFEHFLDQFAALAAGHLGIERKELEALPADWLSVYAWLADSAWTDKPVLYSALELTDLLTTILGGDLPEKHEYERAVIADWCAALGVKVEVREKVTASEKVKQIHAIAATFKVPVIFRDIVQIKKLADVLATLRDLRTALAGADAVAAYRKLEKVVSVREVAGAAALLARSKQTPGAPSPAPLVNEVLLRYVALTEKYLADVGYLPARFDRRDPHQGVKKLALARASREAAKKKLGVAGLTKGIVQEAVRLTRYQSATDEIGNILVSKTVADLLTLAGFLSQHERSLDEVLNQNGNAAQDGELPRLIARFYVERRKSFAAVIPDIFQHRIQRTLGV